MGRILTHEEAKSLYDRFGANQDLQRFYEDRPVEALLQHGAFEGAHRVVEFGSGTGALARELLAHRLHKDASYLGLDVSATMVTLALRRVAPWLGRARIERTNGDPRIPLPDGSCDRILSTYVLDLLGEEDIDALLREAHRVLAPGGLICLASLTYGRGLPTRLVSSAWCWLHDLSPKLVGGCRPLRLAQRLEGRWLPVHDEVICSWGLCTEVLVARRP